jgi:CubicO group peptidase (beta-lactamase class C family)
MRVIRLLGPALFAATTATASAVDVGRLTSDVNAWLKPLVDGGHVAGTLLVAKDSRVLFERSYGLADRERKIAATPKTRFCVASITKPMTQILAIQLIQEKKLGLKDTLRRWIPEFPRGGEITIEHLLRHRAGIPHRVTEKEEESRPTTAADVVRYAARHPLMFEPDEKSSYSSGGYSVLARVLELASGKSYGDLVEERIFRRLSMARSVHPDHRFPVAERGPSYVPGVQGFEKAAFQDLSFLVGAGSVYSTPRDMHRLVQGVVSGKLGESVRQSLVRNGAIHWNGSTNGFRAFVDWDSASGVAVIFAGNCHIGANDLLKQAIPQIVAGERVVPARLPTPRVASVSDDRLRGYQGVYQLSTGPRLEVKARAGRLWANEWVLLPISDSTFFSPRDFAEVRIIPGEDGKVARLDWKQGEQVYPAPRVAELEARKED